MIKAIIIEDERLAMQKLADILLNLPIEVEVSARLRSVRESLDYFMDHPSADVIFSDIQLSDGMSFEIFKKLEIKIPVIFTTGYDQFFLTAFEHNGINYLLKPFGKESVLNALLKYKDLKSHFLSNETHHFLSNHSIHDKKEKKTRLIAKKGTENILLRLEDIVLFYTENKVVYLLDNLNRKFILDRNLTDLQDELDEDMFFRVNRKFILNLNYIKGYRSFEKVKLMIDLNIPDFQSPIIVSQETAPDFRQWVQNV